MAQLKNIVLDVGPARRTAKRILSLSRELTAELAKLDEAITAAHEEQLDAHVGKVEEYGIRTEVSK